MFAIHLFFKWAIKAGLTSLDPALDVQLPWYRRPFRKMFASIEQVKMLISECENQQLKFILYAGIHTGLRKAEIAAAKWSWFDFERMAIISGGAFRLITAIHYNRGIVYIRKFMTHAEYSKEDWKNDP